MSAHNTHSAALPDVWSGQNVEEIAAEQLTLLVMDPSQPVGTPIHQAWIVTLDEGLDTAGADQLVDIALDADCSVDELRLAGIEFAHPEQYDTTVTLAGSDLDNIIWILDGIEVSGAPAAEIVMHHPDATRQLKGIRVPVFG